jgi:simple sugar transport system permease protein
VIGVRSSVLDVISPHLGFDKLIIPIIVVVVLFVVLVLAALLVGTDVGEALQTFFHGTFGSKFGITSVLLRTSPLLLTGVGVAMALRSKVINIGAEGQLYVGALVTTWTALSLELPSIVFIPLLIAVSFIAGGAWASVAAVLKAKFGINEIIVTFMMNFIAIYLSSWAVLGPLKGPSLGLAQTADIPDSAMLPVLWNTRIHIGIIVGILACILIYYFLNKTKKVFEIRAVGSNPIAARSAGISTFRSILLAMVISGGLSGVAGMIEVTGLQHHLLDGISPGYGYTGIVIALVPNLNPLGVIPTALLFGVTFAGSDAVHRIGGLPIGMVYAIQGIIMFAIISLRFRRFKY